YLAPSITSFFYLSVTVTPDCSTLSLHDALPIFEAARGDHGRDTVFSRGLEPRGPRAEKAANQFIRPFGGRHVEYPGHQSGLDEEIGRATSELQSRGHLVCRLLLEKKK